MTEINIIDTQTAATQGFNRAERSYFADSRTDTGTAFGLHRPL